MFRYDTPLGDGDLTLQAEARSSFPATSPALSPSNLYMLHAAGADLIVLCHRPSQPHVIQPFPNKVQHTSARIREAAWIVDLFQSAAKLSRDTGSTGSPSCNPFLGEICIATAQDNTGKSTILCVLLNGLLYSRWALVTRHCTSLMESDVSALSLIEIPDSSLDQNLSNIDWTQCFSLPSSIPIPNPSA